MDDVMAAIDDVEVTDKEEEKEEASDVEAVTSAVEDEEVGEETFVKLMIESLEPSSSSLLTSGEPTMIPHYENHVLISYGEMKVCLLPTCL